MCECSVIAIDQKRKTLFEEVFPNGEVPIKSPLPSGYMKHEKLLKPTPFLELDLKRVTKEQRKKLVKSLSRRFNLPESEVEKDLNKIGCPIRWDTKVVVHWCKRHFLAVL